MKINGKEITGPNTEFIVIPRGGDVEDITFQAQAVLDMSPFDKLCPVPAPPERILKGGTRDKNFDDPTFKAQMNEYADKRMAWMLITSLEATPGLEWTTVKPNDHLTWTGYKEELKASGFSPIEIGRIELCVYTANCLNEVHMEKARKSFQSGLAAEAAKS